MRNYTQSLIQSGNEPGDEIQSFVAQRLGLKAFEVGMNLNEWGESATKVEKVSVAFDRDGTAQSPCGFEVSEQDKMVVTANNARKRIGIVSAQFNPVQTEEMVNTLNDVLEDHSLENLVGIGRDYGDKAVLDVFFTTRDETHQRDGPDSTLSFGLEVRTAHDGSESVRCRPIMIDDETNAVFRGVSEWKRAIHRKPAAMNKKEIETEMYEKFAESVYEMDEKSEEIVRQVKLAEAETIDFGKQPLTVREFFKAWLPNSTPEKLIDNGVRQTLVRANEMDSMTDDIPASPTVTVWQILAGFVYALDIVSNMTDGKNQDRYHKKVHKVLNTPASFEDSVVAEYLQDSDEMTEEEKRAMLEARLSTA